MNLAINRFEGGSPRLKVALLENGRGVSKTEYPESAEGDVVGPTIFGHAGAASAITLAAVSYNDASKPERYSSRGPVTHYFEAVNGITPAPGLGSPQTIPKPDLAATDCGGTTFFAHQEAGVLAVLWHLGRRPARRRRRGTAAAGRSVRGRGAGSLQR